MTGTEIWALCAFGYCAAFAVGLAIKAVVEHVKASKKTDV